MMTLEKLTGLILTLACWAATKKDASSKTPVMIILVEAIMIV